MHPWPLTLESTRWPINLWPQGFTAHSPVIATTTWTAPHTWSAPSHRCKKKKSRKVVHDQHALTTTGQGWVSSEPTPNDKTAFFSGPNMSLKKVTHKTKRLVIAGCCISQWAGSIYSLCETSHEEMYTSMFKWDKFESQKQHELGYQRWQWEGQSLTHRHWWPLLRAALTGVWVTL